MRNSERSEHCCLTANRGFVGKDIAEKLGYVNSRKAIADHVDEDEKGVTKCDTLGGKQDLTVINESGLYSLILSSELPEAKAFKRWITHEVLPAIRRDGFYSMLTDEKLIEVIGQRRAKDDSYLKDSLIQIDAENFEKRWDRLHELWEDREKYDLYGLDDKLAEIAAGNYEFYEKVSAHFWTNHFRAMVKSTDGRWKKPAKSIMRMRTDGLKQSGGHRSVQKAKCEANDYWMMCQWTNGTVPFGNKKDLLVRTRWDKLHGKIELTTRNTL